MGLETVMQGKTEIIPARLGRVVAGYAATADSEHTLSDYWRVCRARWRLIAAIGFGCGVAAAGWSLLQTPIFQAKATVVIDQAGQGTIEKEKGHYSPDTSPEYFQTHFELLKSRVVLQRTAQRLNLTEVPEYSPKESRRSVGISFSSLLGVFRGKRASAPESAEDKEDKLLQAFTSHVEIMPIRGARLAHITVQSEDPRFAAAAANMLANVYIERTQELSSFAKENAAQWFTSHLDELRNKLEASHQALYAFRAKHGLLEGRERHSVSSQKQAEWDSELVKAEMKKAEAQSRFQQLRSVLEGSAQRGNLDWSKLDASAEVLNAPLIQNLRTQEIKVSGEVAELADKYGPLHPKLARAKAELEDLRERIQHEVQKIYDSIKHEYDAALMRERTIKEAAGRHRQDHRRDQAAAHRHAAADRARLPGARQEAVL